MLDFHIVDVKTLDVSFEMNRNKSGPAILCCNRKAIFFPALPPKSGKKRFHLYTQVDPVY